METNLKRLACGFVAVFIIAFCVFELKFGFVKTALLLALGAAMLFTLFNCMIYSCKPWGERPVYKRIIILVAWVGVVGVVVVGFFVG